jgi:hypothetical protein
MENLKEQRHQNRRRKKRTIIKRMRRHLSDALHLKGIVLNEEGGPVGRYPGEF